MKIKRAAKKRYNPKRYTPADADTVVCEDHGVSVLWGDLTAIQQYAVSEGIDTVPEKTCILLRGRKEQ